MHETQTSPLPAKDAGALLDGLAPLNHLGVIRLQGDDAAKFIHGQLTQDFALLGLDQARLAAFCSAKGRMQASFIGFKRSATEILLVCSRDLLPATLKRLSMFVMRAKVQLSDASGEWTLCGLAGAAVHDFAGLPEAPWSLARNSEAMAVRLYPALGVARALWLAPAGTALPDAPALATETWLWSEVQSGIATLTQPVFEAFVPQMLNYESVGGVNFKKGCYPGQEVVARSQFRGTLKRRAFLTHAKGLLTPGQEVFSSGDASQPVGLVVQSAAAPHGGWDALVSLQLSALESGTLHVGSASGDELAILPLPYALLEDI